MHMHVELNSNTYLQQIARSINLLSGVDKIPPTNFTYPNLPKL